MSEVFKTRLQRVPALVCAVILLFLSAAGSAGAATDLYHHAYGMPVPDNSSELGRAVAIDGRTAIVASVEGAYVVENPYGFGWGPAARLVVAGNVTAVALHRDTAVVVSSAGYPVYVFERNAGGAGAWGMTASLHHDHGVPGRIGRVAISGDTIVVGVQGAPYWSGGCGAGQLCVSGAADVYQRNQGGPNAWGLVTELQPTERSGSVEFARDVAISGGTIVVGGVENIFLVPPECSGDPEKCWFSRGFAYVFERDRGGPNAWGRAATLPVTLPESTGFGPFFVVVDGDTAAVGKAAGNEFVHFSNYVEIFDRNAATHTWARVASLGPLPGPYELTSLALSDGRLAVGAPVTWVWVYARNQGGPNAWGSVDALSITGQSSVFGYALSMSGGEVLVGDPHYVTDQGATGATFVFVSDLDGDSLTDDGLDRCPQDPLNNIAAGCRRSIAASPVVDNIVAMSGLTTAWQNGDYVITATFTNTASTAINNPFLAVSELSGGNVLKNGDGGPYGVGATLSPDVGDGLLSPGDSMRVTFVIGLVLRQPFRFVVHVHGDAP